MKKVLFIGSLQEEPNPELLLFLQEIVFGVLQKGHKIINSNGHLLGQYLLTSTIRYAIDKSLPVRDCIENYIVPRKDQFPLAFSDRHLLKRYLRSEFLSFADVVVVIGGGDSTNEEVNFVWEKCVTTEIYYLPHFGGEASHYSTSRQFANLSSKEIVDAICK